MIGFQSIQLAWQFNIVIRESDMNDSMLRFLHVWCLGTHGKVSVKLLEDLFILSSFVPFVHLYIVKLAVLGSLSRFNIQINELDLRCQYSHFIYPRLWENNVFSLNILDDKLKSMYLSLSIYRCFSFVALALFLLFLI